MKELSGTVLRGGVCVGNGKGGSNTSTIRGGMGKCETGRGGLRVNGSGCRVEDGRRQKTD